MHAFLSQQKLRRLYKIKSSKQYWKKDLNTHSLTTIKLWKQIPSLSHKNNQISSTLTNSKKKSSVFSWGAQSQSRRSLVRRCTAPRRDMTWHIISWRYSSELLYKQWKLKKNNVCVRCRTMSWIWRIVNEIARVTGLSAVWFGRVFGNIVQNVFRKKWKSAYFILYFWHPGKRAI